MKKGIKLFLKSLGNLLHLLLNLPILVFISDAFLNAKINQKSALKIDGETLYLATPNFINRFRHKTFFSKEPETLQWIDSFNKEAIFYDIGANVGLYSIYAAKKKNAKVFSFEPSFFNLEFLARNVYINQLTENIYIFPIALNDAIAISNFRLTTTEWGGALSTFDKDFDYSGNKIQSQFMYNTIGFDIDHLVKATKIPLPDHVKIDVDGLEHIILAGAEKVIKNAKSILIEINDNFEEQSAVSKDLMRKAGFQLVNKVHLGTIDPAFNQFWVNSRV